MKFFCVFNFAKFPICLVIIVVALSLNSCGEGSDNGTLNTNREDTSSPVEETENSSADSEPDNDNDSVIDSDNDGVIDNYDICNDTPEGEINNVQSNGCSPSEITVDPEAHSTNNFYMTFNTIQVDDVFQMGSPEDEFNRDGGGVEMLHAVRITKQFDLQTTEVTQYQWHAVLNTAQQEDISTANLLKRPSINKDCLTCPVENISWFEIQKFIVILNKLTLDAVNYRLPTEAEWEYVCRADSNTAFSNGPNDIAQDDDISLLYDMNLDEIGWFYDNSDDGSSSRNKTHMVAEKKPNAWGFYDMHGNVLEFCSDWFVAYDEFNVLNGPAIDDPTVSSPPSLSYTKRSARGGAATLQASQCRSASRKGFAKGNSYSNTGFRLVRVDE